MTDTLKTLRALTVGGVILAYALALLGSWTRINQAGMTCPDWPLCRGAVVPELQGGVVLEWTHRLLALLVSLIVLATIVVGMRLRARVSGLGELLAALAAAIVLQVGLGGITIFQANSPPSVALHWGAAMLLLAVFAALVVVTLASDGDVGPGFARNPGTRRLLLALICAVLAMCAGAFVSSGGAGLACPGFPGCDGTFFGQNGPQFAQMTHRLLAGLFILTAIVAAFALSPESGPAQAALRTGLVLLVLQVTLGILNIVLALPPVLREAHAANAVLTFLAFVVATVLNAFTIGPARVAGARVAGARVAGAR